MFKSRTIVCGTLVALFMLMLPLSTRGHIIDPACSTTGLSISMTAEIGVIGGPLALQAEPGNTLIYTVTDVSLQSLTDCPITDGTVSITKPDGGTVVVAVGVALGGPELRTKSIGGSVSYVANPADKILVGGVPAWRASAGIAGTRHQQNGLDGPASAATTFDTIFEPTPTTTTSTTIRIQQSHPPPVGGLLQETDIVTILAPLLTIGAVVTVAIAVALVSRRRHQ